MADLADVEDDRLDAVADVVRLAGDLLAARQEGLGLAERDDGRAGVDAGDGADDQLALLAGELVEDGVALGLADLLDVIVDQLLGGAAMRPSVSGSSSWSP